ncbi:MAG: phosphate ABC transporter ATP-binding protein PstB [Oscillospiraceae bacterium]|nr:phosphate ABC transporter ATP-binding protein PstB [Oscillospiraceae bacterium]
MPKSKRPTKIRTEAVNLFYGGFHALKDVTFDIPDRAITAIIGPSGCGKSSLLRIFNRMNDLIPGARVEGGVFLDKLSVYDKETYVVSLREKVGMVFQKPNVFPMSIFDNVVFGPRNHGIKDRDKLAEIAERRLTQVNLWKDVKDILKRPGGELSPGNQQLLCIARALAMEPEALLMDESCSALDPGSTMRIEELMHNLAKKYCIITVTHNMEQAVRVSDMAAFMMIDDDRVGGLVEYATTREIFSRPKDKRTEDYITGRFG